MEIKTIYKCTCCGTEYYDEKSCQKCEKSHKIGYKNAERDKYARMRSYPDEIVVQFDQDPDDRYVVYSYSRNYSYKPQKADTNTEVVEL